MKNRPLRNAVIAGTIALIWSIPSLNIFGVIAAIVSWAAYSANKKGTALSATVFYIMSIAASLCLAAVLTLSRGIVSAVSEIEVLRNFTGGIAAFSLVGDILYVIAAVNSFRGSRLIKDSDSRSNGFFD